VATIFSNVTSGLRPRFAKINRRIYMTDGWEPMQAWDGIGSTTNDAGIDGPSQEAADWTETPTEPNAGVVTAGAHKFRYRYFDSKTGYVSDASNEISFTAAGSKDIQLTIVANGAGPGGMERSTDAKVDRIIVEMTTAGGVTFFKAGEVDQTLTTIAINLSDVALAKNVPIYPATGNGATPITENVVVHRNRMFCFGQVVYAEGTVTVANGDKTVTGSGVDWSKAIAAPLLTDPTTLRNRGKRFFQVDGEAVAYEIDTRTSATEFELLEAYAGTSDSGKAYKIWSRDNDIYISRAGYPESFPATSFLPGPEFGRIRAGIGHLNGMLFFTLTGMEKLNWAEDPASDGQKFTVSRERGALQQNVVVNVEETVYSLDRQGFHKYEGIGPEQISRPIDPLLGALVNWAVEDTFHAVFYPRLRAVRWYLAMGADVLPKNYFQYNVEDGTWSTGEREIAITASALVPSSEGTRVLVATEHGYTFFDDEGTCEGCDPAYATLRVDRSATTTLIPIQGGNLDTAGTGLAGVPVYWVEGDEVSYVSENGTENLTVGTAFSSAPSFGHTLHLGRIKAKLKTKAFALPDFGTRHKAREIRIHFEPLPEKRLMRVRFYRDYSATQVQWGQPAAWRDTRGSRHPATAAGDKLIDLSTSPGSVKVSIGDEAVQVTEVELEILEPDSQVKILGIDIEGVSTEAPT